MDIEQQLAKASVKRIKRRQRSQSSLEAETQDERVDQTSHNATKELKDFPTSNAQLDKIVCDDVERHCLTDLRIHNTETVDRSTVDDKKHDLDDFSVKEDFSADQRLKIHDSACHLTKLIPPHDESSSGLEAEKFSQNSRSDKEVFGQQTGVEMIAKNAPPQNEFLIDGTENFSGMETKASADIKAVNSVADENLPAPVTLRRKLKVEPTADYGPNKELSEALQRRSHYLDNLEVQSSNNRGNSEAGRETAAFEKQLEKARIMRQHHSNASSPVIVNEQLSKILQERKVATDISSSNKLSVEANSKVDNITQPTSIVAGDDSTLKSDTKDMDVFPDSYKKDSDIISSINKLPVSVGTNSKFDDVSKPADRMTGDDSTLKLDTKDMLVSSDSLKKDSNIIVSSNEFSIDKDCQSYNVSEPTGIMTGDDDDCTFKLDTQDMDDSIKKGSNVNVHSNNNETCENNDFSSNSVAESNRIKDFSLEIDVTQPEKMAGADTTHVDSEIPTSLKLHEEADTEQCGCSELEADKRSGLKSIDSELLMRKSSWTPMSSDVPIVNDLPRQRTQPVTSKEVEEALQLSPLSPRLNPFSDLPSDTPETASSFDNHSNSRGILKVHDLEKTPLRGILKHPSDNTNSPQIKGILRNEGLQPTEFDSKSVIHGILKHENTESILEQHHHGILKRDSLSSGAQNAVRGSSKGERMADSGTDTADTTPVDAAEADVAFRRHLGCGLTAESDETKTEVILGRTESSEVKDTADNDASEKGLHKDANGKEIHKDEEMRIVSTEDVKQDCFPETFDGTMSTDQRRPDVVRSVSHSRHLTEPTTSDEILEAETGMSVPDIKAEDITPKSSVTERLAALQKSGENWKRRVEPQHHLALGQRPKSFIAGESRTPNPSDVVRRIKLTPGSGARPESIADRLSLLTGSQDAWKSKVAEKDTDMFTVEGKMNRHGIVVESPFANQTKTPVNTGRERLTKVVAIEITPPPNDSNVAEEAAENVPIKVEIPKMDEKLFDEFFRTSATETTANKGINVTVDDFDHIFMTSNDVLRSARKVLPRRTQAGSRNPLKTMSTHIALQEEYMEAKTGIAEREFNRLKRERVVGTPQFAQEALAGLACKENFSKVSLRKAGSFHGTGLGERHLPYKDIMLLRVKGRKWCQTRLVKPHWRSINSGDCFVLVTPDIVYQWIGRFSNVIERNKSFDVANQVCQRHDLGVRPASQLVVVDEEKRCPARVTNKFWSALGADETPAELGPGHDKEDDWYEDNVCLTNRVYSLHDNELRLIPEYSNKLLRHEILKTTEVYVLDFGSEMYVWIGKQVDSEKRRKAVKVAFEFWRKGYDYKDCTVNPLWSVFENDTDVSETGVQRPLWALFGKVNQNMETILFKEKFINWPDTCRLIKVKDQSSLGDGKIDLISDLTPYDSKKMIGSNRGPVSTVLEGSHVGRGRYWEDVEDGIKREFEIRTHETDVWHVTEFSAQKLSSSSFGQFHCEDTYVVRWKYSIHQIARTLKGQESKQALTGRTRCVYFFWQGKNSGINEKGASALMTVELDTERGPHRQISQGKEPPCFLSLFSGRMVVHLGRRNPESTANLNSEWKQFVVRNEMPNEICLVEIPVSAKSLRSRTSFLLLCTKSGEAFIWNGAKSSSVVRKGIKQLATNLAERCPKEFDLVTGVKFIAMPEISEGSETSEFWSAVGGRCSRVSYGSLLNNPELFDYTPRLFYMTSVSGTFEATEIHSSVANDSGIVSAFPFTQEDIYIDEQPALFLLDNHRELFLWQGWWPAETSDAENVRTGTAETRFNMNRKCAMETAIQYASEIMSTKPPPVYLVYAGYEPIEFTSLFPVWQRDKRVILSPSKKIQTVGSIELVSDVLAELSRKHYTFDELQQRPLPDGVDPLKLETYLGEEEFEKILGMKRKEFIDLQTWKQTDLKQKVGLF